MRRAARAAARTMCEHAAQSTVAGKLPCYGNHSAQTLSFAEIQYSSAPRCPNPRCSSGCAESLCVPEAFPEALVDAHSATVRSTCGKGLGRWRHARRSAGTDREREHGAGGLWGRGLAAPTSIPVSNLDTLWRMNERFGNEAQPCNPRRGASRGCWVARSTLCIASTEVGGGTAQSLGCPHELSWLSLAKTFEWFCHWP